MSGSINFSALQPPQNFIFCGRCDDHFMICKCKDVGYGKDYIFRGLPPPSPNLSPLERLRRFVDLVSVSPSMRTFNARSWYENEAAAIVESIQERQNQLRQMIEDYIEVLPTRAVEFNLSQIAAAIGGPHLEKQPASDQVKALAAECRAAIASFIACDWTTVTRMGASLIHNSFEASDPLKYPTDDPHLSTVYYKGLECLKDLLGEGYSDYDGWRLAMESDRQPSGTNEPIQSATGRDYFLRHLASTHCASCYKESDELKTCTACRSVRYCTAKCQRDHWKFHKPTCKRMAEEVKKTGSGGLQLD